jgi:hypothetical protein
MKLGLLAAGTAFVARTGSPERGPIRSAGARATWPCSRWTAQTSRRSASAGKRPP